VRKLTALAAVTLLALTAPTACRRSPPSAGQGRPFIIATYSVLGALVRDLVGDAFVVISAVPNGLDPHEWEPSARDIEALNAAALVVENGLGLEEGMEKVLESRRSSGKRVFTAADHVAVRTVGEGEGIPSGDPDQKVGASDPHLWTDPVAMKSVAIALAAEIQSSFGVNLGPRAADLAARLDALDAEIRAAVDLIPASRRKLVTGHESLGYLARRYGFTLVGAVVPGLSTAAEVSAAELASLKALIQANGVAVIFTEVGTPPGVSQALAREAHVRAVELTTHGLPADGSYFTYMRDLARVIAENLK
jgi:zinc/manganese transport system substrate-binding protein